MADFIDKYQAHQLENVVYGFDSILNTAMRDYAKYKAGVEAGLFTAGQREEISAWFREFPDLWEKIEPNFVFLDTGLVSAHKARTYDKAQSFVTLIRETDASPGGLGFPVVVVAVGAVLFVGAVAGVIWAIGYVKEQGNISRMIDATVNGQLPPDILKKAIAESGADNGFLGDIKTIAVVGLVAILAVNLLPTLLKGKK